MTALLLASLGAASIAPAQAPLTADEAMETYRAAFQSPYQLDCPRGDEADIVVCGRRREGPAPERLPLPVAPDPGTRVAGEPVGAVEAAGSREKCSTIGPNQNCGGGLPVFAIVGAVVQIIAKAIEPDD
ncbi:hypothetical protein [Allosphingosinicella humi]